MHIRQKEPFSTRELMGMLSKDLWYTWYSTTLYTVSKANSPHMEGYGGSSSLQQLLIMREAVPGTRKENETPTLSLATGLDDLKVWGKERRSGQGSVSKPDT